VFWGVVSLIGTGIILTLAILILAAFGIVFGEAAKNSESKRSEKIKPPAAAPSPASFTFEEKRLIEALPEIVWNKSDLIAKGWAKPGQNLQLKSCYFSKNNYRFQNIVGEMQFLTDGERVINMSFYVAPEGNDFLRLQEIFKEVFNSSGTKGNGKTRWTVLGGTRKYCISLVERQFGREVERSLETYVVALSAPCP